MSLFSVLTGEDFEQLQNKGCIGKPLVSFDARNGEKCLAECSLRGCNAIALDPTASGYNCDLYKDCNIVPEPNGRLFVLKE